MLNKFISMVIGSRNNRKKLHSKSGYMVWLFRHQLRAMHYELNVIYT